MLLWSDRWLCLFMGLIPSLDQRPFWVLSQLRHAYIISFSKKGTLPSEEPLNICFIFLLKFPAFNLISKAPWRKLQLKSNQWNISHLGMLLKTLVAVMTSNSVHILHSVPELREAVEMGRAEVDARLMDPIEGAWRMGTWYTEVQEGDHVGLALLKAAWPYEASHGTRVLVFCRQWHACW